MSTPNFTGVAPRKAFVVAARMPGVVGDAFRAIGTRVPDASMDLNQDVETETDIFEDTWSTLGAPAPTMDFEAPVTSAEFDLHKLMLDAFIDGDSNRVMGIEMVLIFAYEGSAGNYTAVRKSDCTIQFTNLGGAGDGGRTNQTFTVHFGGESTRGTVSTALPRTDIAFTPTP